VYNLHNKRDERMRDVFLIYSSMAAAARDNIQGEERR
jgi:hypothetical protein